MHRAVKIRLLPTPEQEKLFWKSAGTARWAYNYFLSENEKIYQEFLDGKSKVKSIGEGKNRFRRKRIGGSFNRKSIQKH
jgi:putative transposase